MHWEGETSVLQRVLIADDSGISRRLLESPLKKWGYEVTVAYDGTQAWEYLEGENAPALAILDWMMPGMTGPEVCSRVRQLGREPYTYILLLTSKSEKEDLIAGMSAGADDYIVKPFDQQELQVRLEAGKRILRLHEQLLDAKKKLIQQATHDDLTGLFNRRRIIEFLRTELNRANREDRPVGIVLADIDKFKSVNDTYGHHVGDAVLRETAHRMQSSIRGYDAVGRYGGEEFLLVLPGCDMSCTALQAERLREALASSAIDLGESSVLETENPLTSLPVTASFGATTYYPGTSSTVETLVKLADEGLYEAKRSGRNRVVARVDDAAPLATRLVDCQLEKVTS